MAAINHQMFFDFVEHPIADIMLLNSTQDGVYLFSRGNFEILLHPREMVYKDKVRQAIKHGFTTIFISYRDREEISKTIYQDLRINSRSLSIGDLAQNADKQLDLMASGLDHLYLNPDNDKLLELFHQSSNNLARFYQGNKDLIKNSFFKIFDKNIPFYQAQPFLSALLFMAYVSSNKIFSDKEVENLFLIGLIKDLGMGKIPGHKILINEFTEEEQLLMTGHAKTSVDLLQSRVPLNKTSFEIIKNHHYYHNLTIGAHNENAPAALIGIETTLVSIFDYIAYMIQDKPFQKNISLFETLTIVKDLISDQYPHEYRALIIFLKNFFDRK